MLEIVLEIGINHEGRPELLEEMVRQSKTGGADWVKFQLYSSERLFGDGSREKYELTFRALRETVALCDHYEMPWFASVFDEERVRWCEDLGIKRYKIATRTADKDPELTQIVIGLGKPTFISFGENHVPVKWGNVPDNVRFLRCVPKYPTPFWAKSKYDFTGNVVGFSDHSYGIGRCLTAIAHGATMIEKHFTLNKQSPDSRDHIGAMDPAELKTLSEVGRAIHYARREM